MFTYYIRNTTVYKRRTGQEMKRTLIGLTSLFLSMGFIVVYHQHLTPIVVEAHTLELETVGSTVDPKIEKEILKKQAIFKEVKRYTEEEYEYLAHGINAEQGREFENEQETNMRQIYAGQVMINRKDQNFMGASTIKEVLYTPGQYACVSDHSWENPITERSYRNAEILLSGQDYSELYGIPKMPDNVIYQAEFPQGSGVWMKIGNTYFCYE